MHALQHLTTDQIDDEGIRFICTHMLCRRIDRCGQDDSDYFAIETRRYHRSTAVLAAILRFLCLFYFCSANWKPSTNITDIWFNIIYPNYTHMKNNPFISLFSNIHTSCWLLCGLVKLCLQHHLKKISKITNQTSNIGCNMKKNEFYHLRMKEISTLYLYCFPANLNSKQINMTMDNEIENIQIYVYTIYCILMKNSIQVECA